MGIAKVTVVWGPPASGKSTYVEENRSENSLTFDFDKIMQAISGLRPHHKNDNLVGLALDIRDVVISKLHRGVDVDDAWIIATRLTDEFKARFDTLDANFVLMDIDKETCLERVDEDPDRSEVAEEMKQVIEDWFEWYEEEQEEPENKTKGVINMAKRKRVKAKKFWEFKSQADGKVGELLLYGDISSYSWRGDEVTPKEFKEDLDALGDIETLNVYINSDGGDVFAGQAIHSMLKRHSATVNVYVDGLAASIASVIAMAGDKIIMPVNAMMMIHNVWTWGAGNAAEFRKLADDLDKIEESCIVTYKEKTGMEEDEIKAFLDAETWLTAEEAVEMGFADEVEESKQIAASVRDKLLVVNGQEFDLSKYERPPKLAFLPKEDEPKDAPPQNEKVKIEIKGGSYEPKDLENIIQRAVAKVQKAPKDPKGKDDEEKLNKLALELELLAGGSF